MRLAWEILAVIIAFVLGDLVGTLMTYARIKLFSWESIGWKEFKYIPGEAWRMFLRGARRY